MKKLFSSLVILMALVACGTKQAQPGYIVQVSLGSWHSPDYSAQQIIGRIDTVSNLIPVEKVIIGWSLDKEIYKEVGSYLHSKGIKMLLWMPVFAETEEMCENSPAVDLWGNIPANYDLDFLNAQLEAMAPYSCAKYPGIEINYREGVAPTSSEYVTESLKAVMSHGFNGAVLSWNIMQAPVAHIDCLRN